MQFKGLANLDVIVLRCIIRVLFMLFRTRYKALVPPARGTTHVPAPAELKLPLPPKLPTPPHHHHHH